MNYTLEKLITEGNGGLMGLSKDSEDWFFQISLIVNFLLLVTTSSSEIMAGSKCKANSIFELLYICLIKRGNCRDNLISEEDKKESIEEV
tara:strand:+ start:111 stop:380 length:270 start_codon:yes stop_codon:yes gene_type:complete